ncbi:hypothetical protein ABZ348_02115 [Streptomyces sp. NPDC005963]|uniref:ornithine cyclodeaminase family protein n=1 Tax=Streptomyces sp. NPDC005963 TaxID=3156721 RepID=UPI003402C205
MPSEASPGHTLVLSHEDVEDLLDLQQAMRVTHDVLKEQAEGKAVARAPMHLDVGAGALRIVSGALTGSGRMGLRASGAQALASDSGAAMLFDSETGALLSVLAYPFATLRTGAMFGLATDVLSPPHAQDLAMVGTGRNALGLIRAASLVRELKRIRVYGRNEEHRAEFAARVTAELGIPAEASTTVQGATKDAEIVFVSTNTTRPVLHHADITRGAFVAGMGTPCEFGEDLYLAADRVIVTSVEHEQNFAEVWRDGSMHSTLVDLNRTGKLPWTAMSEFATVIADKRPGEGTTVFRESSGGYGDIAFATWVYARAREMGRGTEVSFG